MASNGDFEQFALKWFQIFTVTNEMKKMKSGYLLKEILDRFTSKAESTLEPDRSLWMYFAHDITIANMLNSLGLFEVFTFALKFDENLHFHSISATFPTIRVLHTF